MTQRDTKYDWMFEACYEPPPLRTQLRRSLTFRIWLVFAALAIVGGVLIALSN